MLSDAQRKLALSRALISLGHVCASAKVSPPASAPAMMKWGTVVMVTHTAVFERSAPDLVQIRLQV